MSSINWKDALIRTLKDSNQILYKDNLIAIINDAYPKSRHHYLVLVLTSHLNSLRDLNRSHASLIKHMYDKAITWTQRIETNYGWKFGFHAEPSMNRLHLHVLTMDHDSVKLKHRKHWNSFNTEFFIPPTKVISDLENFGHVKLPSQDELKRLINGPMVCFFCDTSFDKFILLRKHLTNHYKEIDDNEEGLID